MTLQPATAIQSAIAAQFMGVKEQQLLTATGSRLTLYRPDARNSVVVPFMSHDVFGIIRAMAAFRVAGGSKGMLNTPDQLQRSDCFARPSSAGRGRRMKWVDGAQRCLVLQTVTSRLGDTMLTTGQTT